MLQVTGGGIDQKDIFGENIDVEKTIKREAMEELKINLNDEESILYNRMSYLYVSEDNEQPGVQLLSKAKSKMTVEEMKKYFEEYYEYLKENNLEVEFKKLHFLEKDNAVEELNKLSNPRRNYLIPLLQIDSKGVENDKKQPINRDIVEIAKILKNNGYNLFVLSNMANQTYEYFKNDEFFSLCTGIVISAHEHVKKPEEKVYRLLFYMNKYQICNEALQISKRRKS